MRENDRGQGESFVLPSEGYIGAFRCNLCGSSDLCVVSTLEQTYLVCTQCGNHMLIAVKEVVPSG